MRVLSRASEIGLGQAVCTDPGPRYGRRARSSQWHALGRDSRAEANGVASSHHARGL